MTVRTTTRTGQARRFRTGKPASFGALLLVTAAWLAIQGASASDFATLCTGPDVVRCYGFDDAADLSGRVLPPYSGSENCAGGQCWLADSQVKTSGNASLRFEIPSNSGADTSGSFFLNFADDLSRTFGPGDTFYVQWRQRFSSTMLTTHFEGTQYGGPWSGGFKQIIVGQGDRAGCDPHHWNSQYCAGSCTPTEIVVQNTDQRGFPEMFPQMYHSCSLFDALQQTVYDPFDILLQNGVGCSYNAVQAGDGSHAPPCFTYKADQWMTFQLRVTLGALNGGYYRGSTIQLWVADEGQDPASLVIDFPSYDLYALSTFDGDSQPASYGKLWLLPYQTQKSASHTHPTAYVWYDDLIVSTSRIPDPDSSGTGGDEPPDPPTALEAY